MQTTDADLPIFRSSGQAALLTLLLTGGDEWRSVSDAARRLGLAPSSVTREADRLVAAGLVEEQRIGNVRRIRADRSSRFFPELRGLVLKAAGPVPVLSGALRAIPGVHEAHVFGSWARVLAGADHPGDAPPQDVDLLVVGDPDPAAVYFVAAEAGAALGQDVEPVIVTDAEWADAAEGRGTGFLRAVRGGSLVDVLGGE